MNSLALFCKTYSRDMLRARRLVRSIQRHNRDKLPLVVSVPQKDLAQFKECFGSLPCHLITDEEILVRTCAAYGEVPPAFPAHLLQQLIKLEFWRMDLCENYVWFDSDSYFIQGFSTSDFLHSSGTPYLVQHDCSDLLDFAEQRGKHNIISDYHNDRKTLKKLFQRHGPDYDFGPSPVIWSTKVLRDMYDGYLAKNHETLFSLLMRYPCELLLYGEFVHQRKQISIYPRKPFFKVYHYAEQFFLDEMLGIEREDLAKEYLGIVIQSNWAKLPAAKDSFPKRIGKEIRRAIPFFN